MIRGLVAASLAAVAACAPASAAIVYQQSGQVGTSNSIQINVPALQAGAYQWEISVDKPTHFGSDMFVRYHYELYCGHELTYCGGNSLEGYLVFSPNVGLRSLSQFTLMPARDVPFGDGIKSYHPDLFFGSQIFVDPDPTIHYVITLSSVPEPATWAMMIAGLGAAGAAARRRKTIGTDRLNGLI